MGADEVHINSYFSSTFQPLSLSSFRYRHFTVKKLVQHSFVDVVAVALGVELAEGGPEPDCTPWPRTPPPYPGRPPGSPQTPGGLVRLLLLGKVT